MSNVVNPYCPTVQTELTIPEKQAILKWSQERGHTFGWVIKTAIRNFMRENLIIPEGTKNEKKETIETWKTRKDTKKAREVYRA